VTLLLINCDSTPQVNGSASGPYAERLHIASIHIHPAYPLDARFDLVHSVSRKQDSVSRKQDSVSRMQDSVPRKQDSVSRNQDSVASIASIHIHPAYPLDARFDLVPATLNPQPSTLNPQP